MSEEYEVKFIDVKPVTRRMIHTHEVTFTCKQCGRLVTQQHYSGRIFYCSEECRKKATQAQTRERVQRHRTKNHPTRVEGKD